MGPALAAGIPGERATRPRQDPRHEPTAQRTGAEAESVNPATVALPAGIRLADGRIHDRPLAVQRHRSIHLGLLHAGSAGFVEITPGTRPPGGKVHIDRRNDPRHFLPARDGWLAQALEHVARIDAGHYARRRCAAGPREEVFVGVAPRTAP